MDKLQGEGDMRKRKYFFRWRKQQVKELEREGAGWHQAGGEMRLVGAGVVSAHSSDGLLRQVRKSGFF